MTAVADEEVAEVLSTTRRRRSRNDHSNPGIHFVAEGVGNGPILPRTVESKVEQYLKNS